MAPNNKPPGWNQSPTVLIPKSKIGANKGRVNLRPEDFDNLIKQHGVRVKVYRTMFCPNIKSVDGGEHQIDCDICNGNGFVDLRPICALAFIQSQELEKTNLPEGYYDGNSALATFERGIELQYFTLIELEDFQDIFYEVIKRQEGQVDVLKYKAKLINAVMDSSGKEYFQGNDFTLDPNGSVRWKDNRGPGPGTLYSIHYEFKVQFRAVKAQHVNRFAQDSQKSDSIAMVKMPEQWLIQREYLVKREDMAGNALAPNKIRESDED